MPSYFVWSHAQSSMSERASFASLLTTYLAHFANPLCDHDERWARDGWSQPRLTRSFFWSRKWTHWSRQNRLETNIFLSLTPSSGQAIPKAKASPRSTASRPSNCSCTSSHLFPDANNDVKKSPLPCTYPIQVMDRRCQKLKRDKHRIWRTSLLPLNTQAEPPRFSPQPWALAGRFFGPCSEWWPMMFESSVFDVPGTGVGSVVIELESFWRPTSSGKDGRFMEFALQARS